jgi:hypothetical protein
MRKFSQTVKTLLATGIYSGFFLIEMNVGSRVLRYTTLPYDISIDGYDYLADTTLAGLDPPKLSNNTDREAFKIRFADPEMSFAGLCDEMMNSRVSVRGGFFNTTGEPLLGSNLMMYDANEAITNIADTLVLYKGFIDSVKYAMSEENGVVLEIECASPMASLDALNSFYSTTNSLRQRIPAAEWASAPDTAFDNLSLGGKSQEILWGKI